MYYQKPNRFLYDMTQAVAWLAAKLIFRRKFLRNEIKGKKGPFVVIANHQCALDFVNLVGATRRPMTFVISNSFYNTLPIRGLLQRLGAIPKQQFQTNARDLKKMKAVIDRGESFVIFPAGLMCEDGLSTPIPVATYKFLKWLKVDVYMARTQGSYFVMPKWTKGLRPGKTYLDIYKLFDKEELERMDLDEIRERTDAALLFDAYREQEQVRSASKKNADLQGLEHVLYQCPHCGREFTITVTGDRIACTACGFAHQADRWGFLHQAGTVGQEIRYVSDWSRMIYKNRAQELANDPQTVLSDPVTISMIDMEKRKFQPVGKGTLTLTREVFRLEGTVNGQPLDIAVDGDTFPSLPFSPGKYLEFQYGETIYRCLPEDGRLVMKYINTIKAQYEKTWRGTKNISQNV